jgi:WD40 repeat protein
VATHKALSDWANDDAQELTTLWVNGMAGTGKTAIASTFAANMEEQGILGATFFVDRQEAQRRDPSRIVQIIAYELAKNNGRQLEAVWKVLRNDPTFERLSFEKQVRLLIKEPLDIACPETLVILIDGLDECGASNGASLLKTLIGSLAHLPIKLFVTSRNEAEIVDALRDIPHASYKLQDVEVSGDVRLYWEYNLDELQRRKRLSDWRLMIEVEELVELTGNLFIYATTILKIISNTRTSPIKKLRDLLEISRSGGGSTVAFVGPDKCGPLENLYIHIVGEAIKDDDGMMSVEYADQLHDILELVIYAQAPLTPQALSDLLHMEPDDLHAYLAPLHSVLVVPDTHSTDEVIRPLHQSFPDFVRQQGGIVHSQLAMNAALAYKNVAERCLFQLNRLLHYNICGLKDASLFNHEVADLQNQLKEHVSVALRYSCRYWLTHWLEHLRAAGSHAQVPRGLDVLCEQHLLHWIEVLSLTKGMNAVQRLMSELMSIMNVRFSHSQCLFWFLNYPQSHPSWKEVEIRELLSDAHFLMRDYQIPISLSALHVYHSGVISMPECALRNLARSHSNALLISERDRNWQTKTMVLEGHTDHVNSVAFSSDDSRIVSGSTDQTVRVWDAISGGVLQTFEGHKGWVRSVAFSSDDLRIVSGSSDSTVRIWDAVSGITLNVLEGHTSWVCSVAFSSDDSRIVSGSNDTTVRIWDAVSGVILSTLEGHTSTVNSVAFSSDDSRIVSGSRDYTVRIWDTVSGVILHSFEGHTDWVESVAFSSDDSRIVSGSRDYTVRIWDTVSGVILHNFEGHTDHVNSVAFSSNDSRIVSGSDDHTVRVWDALLGGVLQTFEGHKGWVSSVAFSSDDLHIASGSKDKTVRIWDAVSGGVVNPLDGHTSWVRSVDFSSDGLRIVSGSNDTTVRIWDAVSGVVLNTLEGHTSKVNSVAFSSDDSRIVSGSDDHTVRIWCAVSGRALDALKGHTHWVVSVAFSSDDLRIVSGSTDQTVRIWDAVSRVILHVLKGHTAWVRSVAFSSDDSRIVSGSQDTTVRIWDAVSGAALHILEGHTHWVCSVAFSSDGLYIMSSSADHTVYSWDADTGALQHILKGSAFDSSLADPTPFNGRCSS